MNIKENHYSQGRLVSQAPVLLGMSQYYIYLPHLNSRDRDRALSQMLTVVGIGPDPEPEARNSIISHGWQGPKYLSWHLLPPEHWQETGTAKTQNSDNSI